MLPNTYNLILHHHKPKGFILLVCLTISVKCITVFIFSNHGQVSIGTLLVLALHRGRFKQLNQVLFQAVEILGEGIPEHLTKLSIPKRLPLRNFLHFTRRIMHNNHRIILNHQTFPIRFIIPEHPIDCSFLLIFHVDDGMTSTEDVEALQLPSIHRTKSSNTIS